jgi:hypothetical protein
MSQSPLLALSEGEANPLLLLRISSAFWPLRTLHRIFIRPVGEAQTSRQLL